MQGWGVPHETGGAEGRRLQPQQLDARGGDRLAERAAGGLFEQPERLGEVGLDFAPRRDGTQERQLAAFERVASACDQGGKVVSIHAVRAATQVLDVLERHRSCERNVCIIHWFSGTSDELTRAVRLGCRFSVGTRMLATKRGRAYVRAIPPDRLLLETDLPDDLFGLAHALDALGPDRGDAHGKLPKRGPTEPEVTGSVGLLAFAAQGASGTGAAQPASRKPRSPASC